MTPTFQGEVQFRRYSDTSTQGTQITLALADRAALESFIGKEGKRFACVLVEIGDDEQAVQPVAKMGPLCREAVELCRNPAFLEWSGCKDKEAAADFIRSACGIESRRDLDTSKAAGDCFKREIRIPFFRHSYEKRQAA